MSWYGKHPMDLDTIIVRGRLANVERTEQSHDFVTTTGQRFAYGAVTIAGTVAGSAAAPGLVTMAGDNIEKAEWVTFSVDGQSFEGWLIHLPMEDGDEVEVIARELPGDKHEVLAVRRIANGDIAVYPHVTRGRGAHRNRSIKVTYVIWLLAFGVVDIAFLIGTWSSDDLFGKVIVSVGGGGLTFLLGGILAYRAARRFRPFVQIAEHVFRRFGWKDVESIDLHKSSWRLKGKNPPENLV